MIGRSTMPRSSSSGRARIRRYRPRLDAVEPRVLLSAFAVTDVADFGAGSLRQAIMDANNAGGANTITFDIPGAGPHVISPATALPRITSPLTIDGYTQPGSSANTSTTGDNAVPSIVIDGAGITSLSQSIGLQVNADNSTLEGLVIQNFNGVGVALVGNNDALLGDFIGTDATGLISQPNGLGVGVLGAGASIGGTAASARNMISGNSAGIGIANLSLNSLTSVTPEAGSVVQNNLIGTSATGSGNLGNSIAGVAILGTGNIVGGTAPGQANTIAFNGEAGSVINLGVGIVIGALEPTANAPISVQSTGDLISGNSIYSNRNLGIGLLNIPTATLLPLLNTSTANIPSVVTNLLLNLNLGVTANNNSGNQTGPDNLENFPVLASAVTQQGTTTIRGTLDSLPNSSFQVQFFSSPTASATGYGEGQVYLGETTVTTGSSDMASFAFTPSTAVPVGQVIAATAIDSSNNTSEFSKAITVAAQAVTTGPLVVSVKRFGIKAQRQSIVLTFNEQLDPSRAGAVSNYSLFLVQKHKHSAVRIASAVYNPNTLTVTLTTKRKLAAHGPYSLTVSGTGAGLTDLNGTLLDGKGNGVPGSDFTTTLGAAISDKLDV
jgi:hypothetical protein